MPTKTSRKTASRTTARKTASASSRKKTASASRKKASSVSSRSTARNDSVDMRDLTRTVKAMFKKAGRDPWDTADMLNKKKIRTVSGKPFTARRVSVYVK